MKLRNKKTGSIYKIEDIDLGNNQDGIWLGMTKYASLAELNAEWEDYEEPKESYYIDCDGEIYEPVRLNDSDLHNMTSIGNYFETREEAEKAVEKLKAWKRLKDKGFRFDGWEENHHNLGIIEFSFSDVKKSVYDFDKDLDLLFGGEEC